MHITTATLADLPQLCTLLELLFTQEHEFKPDQQLQFLALTEIINNSDKGLILVAVENNRIIGMVNLLYSISTALGGRVAILEDLVVLPDRRGQGTGSALIKQAIQLAQQQACRRITLLTDAANHRAQEFYQQHGFVRSSMLAYRLHINDNTIPE